MRLRAQQPEARPLFRIVEMLKIFKIMVVCLVALFSICLLALLLSGLSTLLRPADIGGISAYGGGFSLSFIKLIVVAIIVLAVGLFGLTRLRRFLR